LFQNKKVLVSWIQVINATFQEHPIIEHILSNDKEISPFCPLIGNAFLH